MDLYDLFESDKNRKLLVIFPGGFQPPMPHHVWTYEGLKKKFPEADVFMASSNDTKTRPFDFKAKQWLAAQAGIPAKSFVQVKNPYSSSEITSHYDSENTVLLFALSEKDKTRLGSSVKKDGSLAYLQPWPGFEKAEPMNQHGYYIVTPEIKWSLLGKTMNSASEFRKLYTDSNPKERLRIVKAVYPNSANPLSIREILDNILVPVQVKEAKLGNFDSDDLKTKRVSKIRNKKWLDPDWKKEFQNNPLSKNETIKVGKTIKEIIPMLQDILKAKLYIPGYMAQAIFGSIKRDFEMYKKHKNNPDYRLELPIKYPISKMAIMYVDNQPVSWLFRTLPQSRRENSENAQYWRFTKPEYRHRGYYHRLMNALENPKTVSEDYEFGWQLFMALNQ